MNNAQILVFAAAGFGTLVAANVTAKAIYSNDKIGVDFTPLVVSGTVGIGMTYYILKNSAE